MSIRLLAKDLYRLHRQVEALEREMASASWQRQEELQKRLRELRAERMQLRAALDGQKESRLEKRFPR